MSPNSAVIALDVGEKRIGVAMSDGIVRIARPGATIEVDGTELVKVTQCIAEERAQKVVIGYPRNQSGQPTAQTAFVEAFKDRLAEVTEAEIIFQDESLTSVLAEERLRQRGRPYAKSDIDAEAAVLILQDYLEKEA